MNEEIIKKVGIKKQDTGLSLPSQWDLMGDKKLLGEEPLQVCRVTKILKNLNEDNENEEPKYIINIRQMAKFVVGVHKDLPHKDIEEGSRVGVTGSKYEITLPLPKKIDRTVSLMTVEDKPDLTYDDLGGLKEQIKKLREVVELPLLDPDKYIDLGIDPPKGVLLHGPPGTGKTMAARAVANRTDACFIRVISSELVQRFIGEGARLVREIFNLARSKKACIIFFDEIDAIGGTRFNDTSGDSEVQRTMLEIINQLDGFDKRDHVKILMATNRMDVLDPALIRSGRIDRKIEFTLPDLEGRIQIFKIHAKTISMEKNIRFELMGRLTSNCSGAEIKSICTEAGMFAVRDRRRSITESDMLKAVEKVVKA